MSKFADKLGNIYKTTGPAIGFRKPSAEIEPPPLLLVATIAMTGIKKSKGAAENGIDAAVVSSKNAEAESFKELAAAMNSIPLGLLLEDGSQHSVEEIVKLDWDFVVFSLQTPVDAVNKEGLGKILSIEPSLAPGIARAINELSLGIDGVFVGGEGDTVTVERLLTCQFLASLVGKPLIVSVNSSPTSSELSSLHEAGVKGLLLPEGTTTKTFSELKKLISNLPKAPRRKTKTGVILPHFGMESKVEKVEEEEEEEDET